MTTEKYFSFELQLFADVVTIKGSNSDVVVEGSETTTVDSTTLTAEASIAAAIIEDKYSPTAGAGYTVGSGVDQVDYTYDGSNWTYTETADDATSSAANTEFLAKYLKKGDTVIAGTGSSRHNYTYDGSDWTYTETTVISDTSTSDDINQEYIKANITDKYEVTANGVKYTYQKNSKETGNWTYIKTVTADADTAKKVDNAYLSQNLKKGEQVTVSSGVTYEYDGSDWTYTETATADTTTAATVYAQYLTENRTAGKSATVGGVTYTYDGTNWISDADGVAAADNAVIDAQFLADNPATVTIGVVTYTYDGSDWTYTDTVTADATESADAYEQYLTDNRTAGESIIIGDVTYNYDGSDWISEEETIADSQQSAEADAQYLKANLTTGDSIPIGGVTYTYTVDGWTFDETKTADATQTSEANDQYVAENRVDGMKITVNGVEYTYQSRPKNWTYSAVADATISAEATAQYVEDNLKDGDKVTYNGITYTYNAAATADDEDSWTYPATLTSYLQFSSGTSNANNPAYIKQGSFKTGEERENTSLSSPAYLTAADSIDTYINNAVVDGVGTISGVDEDEYIQITAENSKVDIVDVNGSANLTLANAKTTIGTTEATIGKGKTVTLTGNGNGSIVVNADTDITVGSGAFGTQQSFLIDNTKSLTYGNVVYKGADSTSVTLSNASVDSGSDYINAAVAENSGFTATKTGSRSKRIDTIDVNGAVISGAAAVDAAITATNSGVQLAAKDTGKISVGDDSAELANGSNALITGTGDNAAIAAISALATGGKWITNEEKVTLGANTQVWAFSETGEVTITGDKDNGTTASKVEFNAGTATITENAATILTANDININGAATWNVIVTNEDKPVDEGLTFDVEGNAKLNSDDEKNLIAMVAISGGKEKLFTNGNTGDTIAVTKGDVLDVNGYYDSIIATGFDSWTVKTNAAIVGTGTARQTLQADAGEEGVRAVVSSSKKRNTFGEITDLGGNATLTYGDDATIDSLKVAEKLWTISGDSDNKVIFDANGNASVDATSTKTLSVIGTAEAGVHISNTSVSGAKINNITVNYYNDTLDSNGVDFILEDKSHDIGIATISGVDVDASIEISGDNSYEINGYTFNSTSRDNAYYAITDSAVNFYGLNDDDAVTLTGGAVNFYFGNVTGEVNVSLNGTGVTIDPGYSSATDVQAVKISASDNDISTITGVEFNDTITTGNDDSFVVVYNDTASISEGDVLKVNNLEIGLVDAVVYSTSATLTAENTNDTSGGANVTLKGISFNDNDTLKVSKGTYKIGNSAAVTINESVGYITFDSFGNAEAEDESAHKSREDREKPAENSATVTADEIDAFKVYYGIDTVPDKVSNSTTAGFASAKTAAEDVSTGTVEGGINIYGDASLGNTDSTVSSSDRLRHVTLQSFVADDINVTSEIDGVYTSVIDVSQNTLNTMAAVTANNAVNHTILGGNTNTYSVLMFGEKTRGSNYMQAGSVGSYLYNAGAAATILGGAGNDSILAGENDYVVGGEGTDYFYDMNGVEAKSKGYVIQDYNLAEGDVIIGTKLSEVRGNLPAESLAAKIDVTDKTIAIAGGPTMTIKTAENSTVSAQNIIMADAPEDIHHNVTWAKESGGILDTSAFESGAVLMLANKNNGMADSIVGSAGNDTIFAGGNDTVNPNGGHDEIFLTAADKDRMELGAVVVMNGDKGGRHFVNNWQFGFEETEGDNVLNISSNLYFEVQHDSLIAFSGNDTLSFVNSDKIDTDRFDILVGTPDETNRISVLKSGTNVTVESEDDLGIYYHAVGSNSSIKFAEELGTIDQIITLGSVEYESVANVVLANEGTATVIGDDIANEVVELTGQAENDARKSVSLGGGNDSIISTGTDTALAGNDIYFGQNADGNDVISNFAYYQGFSVDPEADAADVIFLYNSGAESTIVADESNIELRINDSTKLNIKGETNADNMLRFHINGSNKEYVAKIGVSEGKNNTFNYQEEVDVYFGNSQLTEDTLKVAEIDKNVDIWLDNLHEKSYTGIGVVDASEAINTRAVIAGGHTNNTLIGGGEGSRSSLWGGGYGDNSLIGGAGDDVFYVMNGHTSHDTISNMDADNDRIMLFGITLDDIASTEVVDGKVALSFKSGGSITVEDAADGTKISLLEDGRYQEYATDVGNESTGGWKKTE